MPAHQAEVGGLRGTVELQTATAARLPTPSVFATLARPVLREPRDVCFGVYTYNESPEDGDIGCAVWGPDPLATSVGRTSIPSRPYFANYILGQAASDVIRVELIGPDGTVGLPLSSHRVFLAVFGPSARGQFDLRAELAGGHRFSRVMTFSLLGHQIRADLPRYRRPGAVFDDEVGESILGHSYRQIVRRFGAPLRTISSNHRERCVYYDVVGYPTGWKFCFRHSTLFAASGNQPAPPGIH